MSLSLWIARGMTFGTRNASASHVRKPIFGSLGNSAQRDRQDLTYAARLLRRSPGVVAVTIGGLGIAIAVSTSVFSLVNAAAIPPERHRTPLNRGARDTCP